MDTIVETRPRTRRSLLDRQRAILEMIARGDPLGAILDELCLAVEAEAGDHGVRAAILLVDHERHCLVKGAGPSLPAEYNDAIDGIAIAPGVATCCDAAARGVRVITPSIADDPGWADFAHLPLALGLRACWSMPVRAPDGRVLATFGTYFADSRVPSEAEIELVAALAQTVALALQRHRDDAALRASEARQGFLVQLAAATQALTTPEEVMATSARLLARFLRADRCAYALVEDEAVFAITGDYSETLPSIVGRWPVSAFGEACTRTLRAGQPWVLTDVECDPRLAEPDRAAYRATQIRAAVGVPLRKQGRLTAAMSVQQADVRHWTADEIGLVQEVVARCWEAMERARVANALRESEARYRAMVEANPECVKLMAADGTLLQMNAAGLRMIEAPGPDAALGTCVYDLIAPEDRARFVEFNQRVCAGEGGELAFQVIGLGGTRRWMETTATPLPEEGGRYAHLAVTRDVTARVETDRALADSRARLDYAVRLSGIGFWYCDLPFDELFWDANVKSHFFLPPDARVTIETFYDRIHSDDREPTRAAIARSIADRTPYDVVYRTVDPASGAVKWIRALGGTAYRDDGEPIRFDGVTVDVSQHRRDQERLAALLEREREQTRVLGELARVARTLYAAGSVESVLRVVTREASALIGAHQAVTSLTLGEDWSQAIVDVCLSEKYADYRGFDAAPTGEGIYAWVCKNNRAVRLTQAELEAHPHWRAFSGKGAGHPPLNGWLAVPLLAQDGRNLGLVQLSDRYEGEFSETDEAILTQLAQIASVALENSRLYDQLREQDRRKDEFLAMLAHELRNPLAPIRTGLHVLQQSPAPAQAERALGMMERQVAHLVRLVDDLLDVSRITLGKVVLCRQPLDLRDVLEGVAEAARADFDRLGHGFELDLPTQPLPVSGDPTRLAQVASNLLHNAAKYTPSGGRVQLSARAEDGAAVVRVTDTGLGIDREMLGRIFDLFTQVDANREHAQGGLGIGLTLVRSLVEMHGGSVRAESEGAGQGSCFTVRLPLRAAVATEPLSDTGAPAPDAPLRVLVVDDNVDAAEALAMALELDGHELQVAHSGPDALSLARSFDPDVVLLDLGLPGLSGFEVARELRANALTRRAMVVALTGWGGEEDRRRSREAGFDEHLVKPADPRRLAQLMATARQRGGGRE